VPGVESSGRSWSRQQLFEEDSRLQQHRLAARFADELQANRPPELIETAWNGHCRTGHERTHRGNRRAAEVIVGQDRIVAMRKSAGFCIDQSALQSALITWSYDTPSKRFSAS
jgi:hypothetical protein